MKTYPRVCAICGSSFQSLHPRALTCSDACARERKRRYLQEYQEKNREQINLKQKIYRCLRDREKPPATEAEKPKQLPKSKQPPHTRDDPFKGMSLTEVAALARAQHMTYGQYMAEAVRHE